MIPRPLAFGLPLLAVLAGGSGVLSAAKPAPVASLSAAPEASLESTAEGRALRAAWASANYRLTPAVKAAYLTYIKAETAKSLAARGKSLPADFLAWVDGDPLVEATVYGARKDPAKILLLLRSLEIDLGVDVVRKDYTQLALAMAVVHAAPAKKGDPEPVIDISPRPLLKLSIPGDPRKPVDTKDPNRTLDVNDHIVNFLKDHAPIEEEVVVGHKEEIPELKYDDKGIAIPAPKGKAKKIAITEKRLRPLIAADVLESRKLQLEFNAYMKSKGQNVSIDCGDHIIFPKRTEAVKGEYAKGIDEAYKMFRAAYEAKGLLPEKRDPFPTPAERMAYIIRNDRFRFPAETAAQRKWPQYPATAPWPTLTLLAADNQPLREKEDIWVKFRDTGVTRTYGEYIGPIAQQFNFQSARRVAPFAFTYGTYQMMDKDGGVCGTMANMGVRTYNTLGIPSTTAGQPGHCALIAFGFDAKNGAYNCHGGQYATGGDDDTHPHTPWYFGDIDAQRDMVWHQSVAWAVNSGVQSFLDSNFAYDVYRVLPDADRKAHGAELLESGLAVNPYNFVLGEAAQRDAATPGEQISFWKTLKASLDARSGKPGTPADGGLYAKTVKDRMFARIAKLPAPSDKNEARAIYAYLLAEHCEDAPALAAYQVAINGLPSLLAKTETDLKAHVASVRTEKTAAFMAEEVKAAADLIADRKQRRAWATSLDTQIKGRETFFGKRNKIVTDPTAPVLAKLSGKPLPGEVALVSPLLDEVAADLKRSVAGERDIKACRALAAKIEAAAKSLKDADLKRRWVDSLAQAISGREEFRPKSAKPAAKPFRDPCADTIASLKVARA